MEAKQFSPPNCITTYTGKHLNILEPTPDMICIEDIAHGLSNQPRWAGHTTNFYSVAQHSLHCCDLAPDNKKLTALMHDASEAYLSDIPTPIKNMLPEYKVIEARLMDCIAKKFGFSWGMCEELVAIDRNVLEIEHDHLMLRRANKNFKHPLTPLVAEMEFIRVFEQVMKFKNK
jgi:hypothetical protein